MKQHKYISQRGAVSIFVVVFSALFVTIITISFVGLMVRGQQQAANADLSNSAYDAALAGVEDGKRMLVKYRLCLRDNAAFTDCMTVINMMANPECNMVKRGVGGSSDDSEMPIASSSGTDVNSASLDQAYTCVIINYTSTEKELLVKDGESVLVPIDANGASYNKINVSWFTKDPVANESLVLPSDPTTILPTKAQWMAVGVGNTKPPILRTQWIQHSGSFNVSEFDSDKFENAKNVANTKSVFLYPSIAGTSATAFDTEDDRNASAPGIKDPTPVLCQAAQYNFGQYACSVDLDLPDPINNTGSRTGYLQLAALYNSTKVRVTLKNTNEPVEIVAPTIDSTGRANDLFRRVKVGVSFGGEYPRAAFDINGNLCKDFSVTNTTDGYDAGGCDPNNP